MLLENELRPVEVGMTDGLRQRGGMNAWHNQQSFRAAKIQKKIALTSTIKELSFFSLGISGELPSFHSFHLFEEFVNASKSRGSEHDHNGRDKQSIYCE